MKKNIVLIVLDTQRVDRLSCYGYPSETTPYLDQFSNKSTKFEYAIAPAQWTVPTHASIFTGLYPSQHNLVQMEYTLPQQATTLAERLGQIGYKTIGFSQNPLIGQVSNGLSRGFHQFRNYNYLGAGLLTYQLSAELKSSNWAAWIRAKLRSYAAELLGYGNTNFRQISRLTFPIWQGLLQISGQSKYKQMRVSLQSAITTLQNNANGEDKKPVFMFINLMGAHVPYAPSARTLNRFLPKYLKNNSRSLMRDVNNWQVDVKNWLALKNLPLDEGEAILSAFYDAEVAGQDAEVGWFLDQLKKTGLLQNSMIVIVADHGDHLGEKSRLNHAFGVYKELTHVPLLIFDPSGDFSPGKVVRKPVSTRRIFHSIVTAAGDANQDEFQLSLANESTVPDEVIISEGMPLNWAIRRLESHRPGIVSALGYDHPSYAIFDDKYKLIMRGNELELFQYATDVNETTNLYYKQPEEAAYLKEKLEQFDQQLEPLFESGQLEHEDEVVLAHLRALGYID